MKRFAGLKLLALAVMAAALSTPAWATLELQYATGATGITDNGSILTGGTIVTSATNTITVGIASLGTLTITALGGSSSNPTGAMTFSLNAAATVSPSA